MCVCVLAIYSFLLANGDLSFSLLLLMAKPSWGPGLHLSPVKSQMSDSYSIDMCWTCTQLSWRFVGDGCNNLDFMREVSIVHMQGAHLLLPRNPNKSALAIELYTSFDFHLTLFEPYLFYLTIFHIWLSLYFHLPMKNWQLFSFPCKTSALLPSLVWSLIIEFRYISSHYLSLPSSLLF